MMSVITSRPTRGPSVDTKVDTASQALSK